MRETGLALGSVRSKGLWIILSLGINQLGIKHSGRKISRREQSVASLWLCTRKSLVSLSADMGGDMGGTWGEGSQHCDGPVYGRGMRVLCILALLGHDSLTSRVLVSSFGVKKPGLRTQTPCFQSSNFSLTVFLPNRLVMETAQMIHRSPAHVRVQRGAGVCGQGDQDSVQALGDILDRLVDPAMSTSCSSEPLLILPATSRRTL